MQQGNLPFLLSLLVLCSVTKYGIERCGIQVSSGTEVTAALDFWKRFPSPLTRAVIDLSVALRIFLEENRGLQMSDLAWLFLFGVVGGVDLVEVLFATIVVKEL